jgi:anti-sigma28 factor (negative regulator of flagellin synthesis)
MTIKNGDTAGVSRTNLDQTSGSRKIGSAESSGSGSIDRTPGDDSIALSNTNGLVQQALTAGTDARSARILQLQQLVATNQYRVDAGAVASALIDAHLAGD